MSGKALDLRNWNLPKLVQFSLVSTVNYMPPRGPDEKGLFAVVTEL